MKRPPLTLFSLALIAPVVVAAPAKKPAVKPGAKPKPTPKPKPVGGPRATPTPAPRPPQPVPTPVVEPVETGPKTWAVLVGVSQYQSSGILSLKSPSKDATGIRDALVDPKLGRIPARQILLLTDEDATREKILGSVDNFLRPNLQPGDKVVFFLAGHGVAKGAGLTAKSYFLPTDTRGLTTAAFDSSAVPLRVLADNLGMLPASQFVIFVDACREDPTPGRGSMENNLSDVMSRGITVIPKDENAESATFFACSNGQRAFEDEKFGHGVFTNAILEGLKQGAVAQKPDGAVNMGRLSSYVKANVGQWAKEKSATGDFEVVQTPELVAAGSLKNNMVLLNLRSALPDTPYAIGAPRLMVAAPEGARVQINGAPAGVGTVEKDLPADGEYTITVTSPGFAPVSRSVTARGGFEQQVVVQMQPLAGGATAPVAGPALDFYKRADEAMNRQQWEMAEQGYRAAMGADPKFGASYEALIDLHLMQGRNVDSLADAILLLGNVPKNAHSLALVSRAYSQYAVKGAGQNNLTSSIKAVSGYGLPKKPEDAPKLGVKAAMEGIAMDANSSEANVALGYALAALDKGKNKSVALAAWGKAAFADPTNASNQLGLGYGIRYYAAQDSKMPELQKTAELNRAVATLKEALKLRPGYYEAHRELAFCYMALGNTEAALSECSLARANRGAANDINEIAGIEVAMSGLHAKAAVTSTGDEKTAHEEASKGYLEEAKETSPNADLKLALAFLGAAGVGSSLRDFMPAEMQGIMNTIDSFKSGGVGSLIPKIGGGLRIPGF
jgi:tetratricopeptide (TPR) repeat protein